MQQVEADQALLLAFDTSQGALSVALTRGRRVLASHFELLSKGHAERLLPCIDGVLDDAGVACAELTALAVTIGPGTFTGIRAGMAAARGLALPHRLTTIGVTSLEAVAATAPSGPHPLLVSFDARRGEAYWQLFAGNDEVGGRAAQGEPALDALEHIVEMAKQKGISSMALAGTGAALLHPLLAQAGMGVVSGEDEDCLQPSAVGVALAAQRKWARIGLAAFAQPPSPLYIRAPDAKLPGGLDLPATV